MDDLISRQGAIEGKMNLLVRCDDDKLRFKDFVPVEYLQNLPSAEPVRMKGKWIIHETENDRYDDMICPFCKTCYTVDAYRIDDIGLTAEDFNFCPNCGAMMS